MINSDNYLNSESCIRLFSSTGIYVFGTGIDAEKFIIDISDKINVLAFVDNNRHGKNRKFYGKDIISIEQCLEQKNNEQPILITSYRFAKEISLQLTALGLSLGIDYYIWDNAKMFCSDKTTLEFIDFLKSTWSDYKVENPENKILIPFENKHNILLIVYAYCSNYFAKSNRAEIYGYFGMGVDRINASDVIKDIYKAFNVKDLVNVVLNDKYREEADKIADSIWNKLFTWKDWKNITVYGIHFGTTIIRHLLRVYIPSFDLRDEKMHSFFKEAIDTIVFWYHYIYENDISVVILADGVTWDGYIRDIALTKGIPTYAVAYHMAKMTLNYCGWAAYEYFDKIWEQLTKSEQINGIEWAKKQIEKRLKGGTEEVHYELKNNFVFAEKKKINHILERNDKLKILICPHIFEEDCYQCGEQIFDDNYFSWLCHLGELSNKTLDYDWYLKMHPFSHRRDFIIIDMILEKYPRIKKLPSDISPHQLKEEGVKFALTVNGTIGHEYPEIGIQVINAGKNPHSCFDFTWNPKTKEEYDYLIMHLEDLDQKTDEEGLYKFYCLNYLYYNWDYVPYRTLFFKNPLLAMERNELEIHGKVLGTWMYEEYMKDWTKEDHDEIMKELEKVFQGLEAWRPDILYRK